MRVVVIALAWLLVAGTAFMRPALPSPGQNRPSDLKEAALISEGNGVFAKNCSVPYCHGKDGTGGRAPAVNDRKWRVDELHEIVAKGIPNSSMPNWDDKLSEREIWAAVAYILSISAEAPASGPARNEPPAPLRSPVEPAAAVPESLVGDSARGEQLFFATSGEKGCAGCHVVSGKGNPAGQDLGGASRRSAREIFRDIVFPGERLDRTKPVLEVTMKDGEKITGIGQEETAAALRVLDLGSAPPVLRRLARDQIQSMQPLTRSPMPARYAELYTLRELLDLVAFLKSVGGNNPAKVTFLDLH